MKIEQNILSMRSYLPPLRLTGALTLRDGELSQRTVALANGRIASGPHHAIDMTGYLVLPGIVDLCSDILPRYRDAATNEDMIWSVARELSSHGVTSALVSQGWGWDKHGTPDDAIALGQALAALKPNCDLALQLRLETGLPSEPDTILQLQQLGVLRSVLLSNTLSRRIALADTDPASFSEWSRGKGLEPARLLEQMRAAYEQRAHTPRRLCRLAERFDEADIRYGSLDDPDGETREMYSILGAKLCAAPATHSAAAVAKAVGDPVLLPASRFTSEDRYAARKLLAKGKCQAIYSAEHTGSLASIAFSLSDEGLCSFSDAWALISTRPAHILHLADRGEIAPGKRADLTIVNEKTRQIEVTISKGRISYMCGEAINRFLGHHDPMRIAAE